MQTDFNDIEFNPEWHTYTHAPTRRRLVPVTKKIGEVTPPFDQQAQAARVAERQNRTVESVLAEWEQKRVAGQERGKRVHNYITNALQGTGTQDGDPFLALNQRIPEEQAFDDLWTRLRGETEIKRVEWVTGDLDLGIAGTCDALLYSPQSGLFHTWDWKSGKWDMSNRFERLLAPFGYLDNCKFAIYSLQVSLYRLIIERNTDLKLGESYLAYLSPDGNYQIHRAKDMRGPLTDWLSMEGGAR